MLAEIGIQGSVTRLVEATNIALQGSNHHPCRFMACVAATTVVVLMSVTRVNLSQLVYGCKQQQLTLLTSMNTYGGGVYTRIEAIGSTAQED